MRRRSDDDLHKDINPRRSLIVGAIFAVIAIVAAMVAMLVLRLVTPPRQPRRAELPPSADTDRQAPSPPDRHAQGDGLNDPLRVPDGGWPSSPRTVEQMDEVPAGLLRMGSKAGVAEDDETPAGEVMIPTFMIDRYEITNEQYSQCVEDGVCQEPLSLQASRFGGSRQPIVGVSWFDASTYCRWAGKRLPTEAEWERAARGDDGRSFPWGEAPPSCDLAVFTQCDRYGPAEVGGRSDGAGPFGTQDLAGNVWEWVQDWYAPRYYPSSSQAPPAGPPAGRQRVLRGGSWHFGPQYIRATNRHRDDPSHRSPWYGFRCAWSPPPPEPTPPLTPPLSDAAVDDILTDNSSDAGPSKNIVTPPSLEPDHALISLRLPSEVR